MTGPKAPPGLVSDGKDPPGPKVEETLTDTITGQDGAVTQQTHDRDEQAAVMATAAK